jgi:hypothetical protein
LTVLLNCNKNVRVAANVATALFNIFISKQRVSLGTVLFFSAPLPFPSQKPDQFFVQPPKK